MLNFPFELPNIHPSLKSMDDFRRLSLSSRVFYSDGAQRGVKEVGLGLRK